VSAATGQTMTTVLYDCLMTLAQRKRRFCDVEMCLVV
jgi:hypothetical protein